jgi:putative pyruvate formate lyase activating enzyme
MIRQHCQNRRKFLKTLGGLALSGTVLPALGSINIFFSKDNFMKNIKIADNYTPGFVKLHKSGELKARAEVLWDMMRDCSICPRECGTNRIRGRRGDCNSNANLEVSSFAPHFGEERELVGTHGSGTIFFTNCSLLCVFCINYDISQLGKGQRRTIQELANMMLTIERMGCHNLNLVTPTHYTPHILKALDIAAGRGFRLPVVWNTCGWEKLEVMQLLDGVVDIYLADFKYDDPMAADKYSPGAISYPHVTRTAIAEMNRQVGVPVVDSKTGLIYRGLMIRHLVMPNNVARTDNVLTWIGENLPKDTYVNVMSQYTPVFKSGQFPEINRRITQREYNDAINFARKAGLVNLRLQGG